MLPLGQASSGQRLLFAVSYGDPLQAIEVFRKGGTEPGQVVLLEQQVQKDVDLIKPAPEEAVSAWVRLSKHLWKGTQNKLKVE